jgi:hypothetical protein
MTLDNLVFTSGTLWIGPPPAHGASQRSAVQPSSVGKIGLSTAKHPKVFNFLCLAVDTFRNDTSGYTPELKWSVLKVSTAKTGRQSLYNTYRYYLTWSVLKVSTAQGIIAGRLWAVAVTVRIGGRVATSVMGGHHYFGGLDS